VSRVVSDIYWKAMAGLTVWNMFAGSTEPVWSSEIPTKCAPVAWLRIRIHDMLLNLFVISSSIWKNTLNTWHQINFKFGVFIFFKNLVWLDIVLRFSDNPWNVCSSSRLYLENSAYPFSDLFQPQRSENTPQGKTAQPNWRSNYSQS